MYQFKVFTKSSNAASCRGNFLLNGKKHECYLQERLLSIPSKVVEHLICSQLNDHLNTFNLQNEHQWRFLTKRSTEDVLLYITEKWRSAIDAGKSVGVIFYRL